MERNDNFGSTGGMGENTGAGSGSFGTGGFGNSGSTSGSAGYGSGSSESGLGGSAYGAGGANYGSTSTQGGFGTSTESGEGRLADAKEKLGNAKDAAADKLSGAKDAAGEKLGALKEKASNLTATLADKLEAGAEKLRGQGGSMAFAGGGAAAQDDRMKAVSNQLAGGMQGAADWLREGDLRATIEQQVKEHPGRTLLIALGVGYVLGKTFRK